MGIVLQRSSKLQCIIGSITQYCFLHKSHTSGCGSFFERSFRCISRGKTRTQPSRCPRAKLRADTNGKMKSKVKIQGNEPATLVILIRHPYEAQPQPRLIGSLTQRFLRPPPRRSTTVRGRRPGFHRLDNRATPHGHRIPDAQREL